LIVHAGRRHICWVQKNTYSGSSRVEIFFLLTGRLIMGPCWRPSDDDYDYDADACVSENENDHQDLMKGSTQKAKNPKIAVRDSMIWSLIIKSLQLMSEPKARVKIYCFGMFSKNC
jgi:hypothetical protein